MASLALDRGARTGLDGNFHDALNGSGPDPIIDLRDDRETFERILSYSRAHRIVVGIDTIYELMIGVSPQAALCWVVLRRHGATPLDCWPSLETIADQAGRKRRWAATQVAELTAAGWITPVRRHRARTGHSSSNGYWVHERPVDNKSSEWSNLEPIAVDSNGHPTNHGGVIPNTPAPEAGDNSTGQRVQNDTSAPECHSEHPLEQSEVSFSTPKTTTCFVKDGGGNQERPDDNQPATTANQPELDATVRAELETVMADADRALTGPGHQPELPLTPELVDQATEEQAQKVAGQLAGYFLTVVSGRPADDQAQPLKWVENWVTPIVDRLDRSRLDTEFETWSTRFDRITDHEKTRMGVPVIWLAELETDPRMQARVQAPTRSKPSTSTGPYPAGAMMGSPIERTGSLPDVAHPDEPAFADPEGARERIAGLRKRLR